jgi:hypothetical protein
MNSRASASKDSHMSVLSKMMTANQLQKDNKFSRGAYQKPNPMQGKVNMSVKGVLARKKLGVMNSEAMASALISRITTAGRPMNLMALTGQPRPATTVSNRYVPPSSRGSPSSQSSARSSDDLLSLARRMCESSRSCSPPAQSSRNSSSTRKSAFAHLESNRSERGNAQRTWRVATVTPPNQLKVQIPSQNPWTGRFDFRPEPSSSPKPSSPKPSSPKRYQSRGVGYKGTYLIPTPGARNENIGTFWRKAQSDERASSMSG